MKGDKNKNSMRGLGESATGRRDTWEEEEREEKRRCGG